MLPRRGIAAAAVFWQVAGCASEPTDTNDGGISVQVQRGSLFTVVSADQGRVHVEGPTSQTITVTPGTTQTITGLLPGTYRIALEGLALGEVESFGETAGITVLAGRNSRVNVTLESFVPAFVSVTSNFTTGPSFNVQFDPVTGANRYRVEWALDPAFTNPQLSDVTVPVATIQVNATGTYHVRVRAIDRFDGIGRASSAVTATVLAPPTIALSRASENITAFTGSPDLATDSIAVSNGGGGALGQLSIGALQYASGQPTGWLTAQLDRTTAPASVILTATSASLTPGAYDVNVPIMSANAVNNPQTLKVHMNVVPNDITMVYFAHPDTLLGSRSVDSQGNGVLDCDWNTATLQVLGAGGGKWETQHVFLKTVGQFGQVITDQITPFNDGKRFSANTSYGYDYHYFTAFRDGSNQPVYEPFDLTLTAVYRVDGKSTLDQVTLRLACR